MGLPESLAPPAGSPQPSLACRPVGLQKHLRGPGRRQAPPGTPRSPRGERPLSPPFSWEALAGVRPGGRGPCSGGGAGSKDP